MYPTLFISHGAPNIILGNSFSKKNIRKFSKSLEKAKYIIIFSAHYVSNDLKMVDLNTKDLMYDFYGFEEELYKYKYKINSDKDISLDILNKLQEKNIDISLDKNRTSFDHGVWSTLAMMYDSFDIPVIQLSIPANYTPKQLIDLGESLQIFKDEAMIICSGGVTHNLYQMKAQSQIEDYAYTFNQKIIDIINSGDKTALLNINKDELFIQNHPTNEHFLPLYIAFGNAKNRQGHSFNHEISYSNISMECFAFDKKETRC